MARCAPLVDPRGEVTHLRDSVGDLVPEEHSAAARLRSLADDDFDRVRAPQVVWVHPVARGEELVDERLRVLALLGCHATVTGRRRRPDLAGAAPERLLGRRGQRAEAHPRDRYRDPELEWLRGIPRSERDVRVASLAVALERIAGDARPEHE